MPDLRTPSRAELAGFVVLCCLPTALAFSQASGWGDALSAVDAYSEANAIRGARNFVEHGFAATHGLPNVFYPGLYDGQGFAGEPMGQIPGVTPEGVYTHYPPGPEYLLTVAMMLTGSAAVSLWRLLPLTIGLFATLFLGFAVRRRIGRLGGWIAMAACLAVPSFYDAQTYLHYDGYAQALLLVEIAAILCGGTPAFVFAVLGFLQGWLSFDYAFLVVLTPPAVELCLTRLGTGDGYRSAFLRAFLVGFGFCAAHGLHFLQVCLHLGSLSAGLGDILGAAAHRSGALQIHGVVEYLLTVNAVVASYLIGTEPLRLSGDDMTLFRFAGLSLGPWCLLVTATIACLPSLRPRLKDWLLVSAAGMAVSCFWYVTMVNHAIVHHHFLYRHMFFGFFIGVLFLAGLTRPGPGSVRS